METNSTSKKQPIKKQRLSVGLARVSSPSNAIQTTDSNTQDELNGVPDNKTDKNIIENTKMVENDAKETDKDNSADSDKELSSRGLKRKADDTENDQITNENEMPENSLPEDTAADKSETEALPSEELVQITQSVKKSKPAGRRRSKPLTMKKKTSKPKMSPAKKLILNEQLDTTDDNKLQIDEDDITEKDMTEGDEENKPDVKEIEDNENKTDTKIKENIEEQGDGEKSDKNQDEENNSEVTSTMDVDHAEITSPVSAISRLSQKSVRANRNNSPAAHLVKKPKIVPDLSNPAYLKPFQHGWKRELVYRATTEANGKRNGDIYYYTPAGKKVRSMREVAENLKNKELTLEDFTFFKEPLGINDPLIEIIRDAKIKTPGGTAPSAVKKTPKLKKEPKVSLDASGSPVVTPKASKASKPAPTHIKVKVSGRLNLSGNRNSPKADKKRNSDTTDLEMGMLPPGWDSPKKVPAKQIKTPTAVEKSPVKTKRSANKAAAIQLSRPENERNQFMQHFFMNISAGYNALLQVFQYLKVQELLRAGKVCRMWRDLANHPSLWKIVRMKNSQVYDWDALTDSLIRHGTQTLDLRKMLLLEKNDDFWTQFSSSIGRAESLTRIELCRCPATVVEELSKSNPNLEVINAVTIRCETLDLSTFNNLTNLQELRLKSQKGMTLNSDLSVFKKFTNLKHLSLTSVKSLGKQNVDVVGELINLESLELGECSGFSDSFGTDIISKLQKLKKLRLEKDPGSACTDDILKAVSENPKIEQLELINFEVKMGFDEALAKCTNLKKFLIIPTYICQSATTNHMLLKGIIQLSNTLSHFIWGVTLELLRVTELFVDQYDKNSKKEIEKKNSGSVENIPVLKPVPFMVPAKDKPTSTDNAIAKENPQVEILPLVILQKLLCENLPNTRVKILKIPFHATWRQSIHDSTQ